MYLIDRLVEARVAEAAARGELDDLPGAGRPVALDDDSMVPEALRTGYRLLKNAGYIPPEVAWRREIREVEQLLAVVETPAERSRAMRRLNLLLARVNTGELRRESHYYQRLLGTR
jgi:hypothetical protein